MSWTLHEKLFSGISGSYTGTTLLPEWHLAISGDAFGCHNWERAAVHLMGRECKGATWYPEISTVASTEKNYPSQNVSSAFVEKSLSKSYNNVNLLSAWKKKKTYILWSHIIYWPAMSVERLQNVFVRKWLLRKESCWIWKRACDYLTIAF